MRRDREDRPPSLPAKPPPSTQQQQQTALAAPTTASFTRRRWLRLLAAAVAQLYAKPRTESSLKYAGGFVAALAAMRYARSLTSATLIGLFAGIVAHSLYADVLKKAAARPSAALASNTLLSHAHREDGGDESDDDDDDDDADRRSAHLRA